MSSPRPRTPSARCWTLATVLLSATITARAAPDLKSPPLPLIATKLPVISQLPAAPAHAVFRIEKSENKNQVHYGVRVDEACHPLGSSPVYAYWRMRERGPNITEPLLDREQPGYGVHPRQQVTRTTRGGSVRVHLRAWPDRPLTIEMFRTNEGCAGRALLDIQHSPTVVQSIYIDIGFLFSVNYALLRGIRITDGAPIQEQLRR